MAIVGVKFPELKLATQPSSSKAQKLHRQTEGMDVLDLLVSHHYLCLSLNPQSRFSGAFSCLIAQTHNTLIELVPLFIKYYISLQ